MKKILAILLCLLALCACGPKVSGTMQIEEGDEPEWMVGGWLVNPDLPPINDAVFEKAQEGYVGMTFQPLQRLGSQVVAGTNIAYLAYGEVVAPDAATAYKVVIVNEDLQNNASILKVADFNIENYLEGNGNTTPEGMGGGWTDNSELPNMVGDDLTKSFNEALEGIMGVGYEPVCVLATQVVAGTNYAFLAKGTTVTPEAPTHLYIVSIYVAMDGSAKLNNICAIDLSTFNE